MNFMNIKLPNSSSKNLQKERQDGNHGGLTSQPRPQGDHPRARGNKAQPGYIQTTSQPQEQQDHNICNTFTTPTQVCTMIHK